MKFVLTTTPIRPVPTDYPPVGSTSLLDELIKAGYDPYFFDIDALRPSFEEVTEFFKKHQPDILGISAVVSTAYRYTRDLTHMVKRVSPHTKIILGGNLAASSEILLKKCPIDVCVVGEGERVLMELVKHWETHKDFSPNEALSQIKGITYLDTAGEMRFTGYSVPVPREELPEPNYDLLVKFSDMRRFLRDPLETPHFAHDPRSYQPHRIGKKLATLIASKGCTNRCTFCHRWDKGYRSYSVDRIVASIKHLKEHHNVGFIRFGDENFASDAKQVEEFIEAIKPLDVLFDVCGIRVTTIDRHPDFIRRFKEAGCVAMFFGMESGSPKMLEVMEKKATLEQNIKTVRMLVEEGMYTVIQLVIGMPGENEQTVNETIEFAKAATEIMDDVPYERLSVNYFQALPGTPGYEFVRERGILGNTLEEEEAYLLKISDVDASSFQHYMNASESDTARARLWTQKIVREATINYYKKRGWKPLPESRRRELGQIKDYARGGYFRIIKSTVKHGVTYWWIRDKFRWLIEPLNLTKARIEVYGLWHALLLTLRLVSEEDRTRFMTGPISLRKVMTLPEPEKVSVTQASMIPLRAGR